MGNDIRKPAFYKIILIFKQWLLRKPFFKILKLYFQKEINIKSPFWVTEVYGLGYWLKDYGYYPKRFPLFCYMDHGNSLFDTIPAHEKENDAPLVFKFSPRLVEAFKQTVQKPAYCVMNPTIHCRNKKKIIQNYNAKGTLFFPAHSTDAIDDATDWIKFIKTLNDLPTAYKPIDICLHYWDMKKGLDKLFNEHGYNVFSAGAPFQTEFPFNMYSILKNYRFTMSNLIGSYTFYSVEMDIPFSLYGEEPKYTNTGDPNIEKGAFTSYKNQTTYLKANALFNGLNTEITPDQKKFVNYELGKEDSISRLKTWYLLYKSLWQYLQKHPDYF